MNEMATQPAGKAAIVSGEVNPFCYFFAGAFSAGFFSAAFLPSSFTSTVAAVIVYSMVTLEPTFRSPLTFVSLSRATSHLSLPFLTTMTLSLISRTGPVTW
jgi:hypothetical protein